MRSVLLHFEKFRCDDYSTSSTDVKTAWIFFVLYLLPKVSTQWADEMTILMSNAVGTKQFGVVTVSDEAFVFHVLSWYMVQWEMMTDLTNGLAKSCS